MPIVDVILEVLHALGDIAPRPFETKYAWNRRLRNIDKPQFERGVRQLIDTGMLEATQKNNQKFLQLTKTGQLEVLLIKARKISVQKWDGRWRLIMFDIPEAHKNKRQLFRSLLKENGFYKLQASVYISPFALNSSAVSYLTETGLIQFIRILRVDKMDNDKNLKKYFKLSD